LWPDDFEVVAAITDMHSQPLLDLTEVFVELSA
jgi:hypothetical protein